MNILPDAPSSRIFRAVLGATVALAMTACEEESFTALSPLLVVQGCSDVNNCSVGAGDVPTGSYQLTEIVLENSGDAVLTLESVVLDSASDPAYQILEAPTEVLVGEVGVVIIKYTPILLGRTSATVVVRSDAGNVACDETTACDPTVEGLRYRDVTVGVSGQGLEGAAPAIDLDKVECDFGRVGIGATGACSVSIGNSGDADLVLQTVEVGEALLTTPAGSVGASVFIMQAPVGVGIAPGLRQTMQVEFSPDALGSYAAIVTLTTNDPARPLVELALVGEQVDAPTCQIRIGAVNNIAVAGVTEVEPLDDITLSAYASTPASSGSSIESVQWTFVERPTGSTIEFSDQGGLTTHFSFANGVPGVDLAGHYRIAAQVTDSLGALSTNLCELAFDAVPSEAMLVQLGWDTSSGDMDLHLIKMDAAGGFCSNFAEPASTTNVCGDPLGATDCHWNNCTAGGLDWDANGAAFSPGDPSLDIDDLCGFGPENVTLESPEPGQYLVAAHYWGPSCGGGGQVGNTMRVFLGGVLSLEIYKPLNIDEFWEAAIIHWYGPDTPPCVERMDQPGSCG